MKISSLTQKKDISITTEYCVCIIPHTATLSNNKFLYLEYRQVTCPQTSASQYPFFLIITADSATATTAVLTAILREREPSFTVGSESRRSSACANIYWAWNEFRNFIQSIHNSYIQKWGRLPTGSTQTFLLSAYSDLLSFIHLGWIFIV